ncbi:MAG: DUF433 domain-containing protein [Candidatus Omnitrophica bacterium]|nr:DUF433 domain-containing protein [Candidatus Omnitrophota bacterium]
MAKTFMNHCYITHDIKIQGGEPIIKGTRFPARSIVFYIIKEGMLPEELVKEFPQLSLAAIYDALSYYYDHKEEIEALLEKQKEEIWKK